MGGAVTRGVADGGDAADAPGAADGRRLPDRVRAVRDGGARLRVQGANRWRPVADRPREGWDVLPHLRWVVLGALAAAMLLALTIAVAVADG